MAESLFSKLSFLASSPLVFSAHRLLWAGRERRRTAQKRGVNVVPANFYSAIPSIQEIEQSFEYRQGGAPFMDAEVFDAPHMRAWLEDLIPNAADFSPPLEGDEAHPDGYFWKSSQFSFSDAMAYYAVLRKNKPKRVLEIGSGFSTLVAAAAIKANGVGEIVCIEPYPRPFLAGLPEVAVIPSKAQDIAPADLNALLSDGDVLFIDSTHTVKSGSDCVHIYLRLLPKLRRNVLIQIHDIFLPFGLPQQWLLDLQIHWTEQYLVMAWLQGNARAKLLYGSAYHAQFNGTLLERLMHGRFASGGSSIWVEYAGRADSPGRPRARHVANRQFGEESREEKANSRGLRNKVP